MTLELESGSFICFQPDTGAQCNVLPLHIYKKASKDEKLEKVQGMEMSLIAHGGSRVKVVGRSPLRVRRNGSSFLPDCRLVDNEDIRPILGRKACIGMGILVYQDNDHLNKPEMGNAPVYAVQTQATVLSKEELVTKFKGVQGGSWKLGWCIQNQAGSHSAASPTCSEAGCSGIAAETQRNVG